jgi:hypothetical protein
MTGGVDREGPGIPCDQPPPKNSCTGPRHETGPAQSGSNAQSAVLLDGSALVAPTILLRHFAAVIPFPVAVGAVYWVLRYRKRGEGTSSYGLGKGRISVNQLLLAPLRIKLERILISLADEPLSRKWHDRRPQ